MPKKYALRALSENAHHTLETKEKKQTYIQKSISNRFKQKTYRIVLHLKLSLIQLKETWKSANLLKMQS